MQQESIRIGFFGEAMVEIGGTPMVKTYGGDVLNAAIYMSRLARKSPKSDPQFDISFITAVGRDTLSDELLTAWQGEGIDLSLTIRIKDKRPGLYLIETLPDGERVFHYWRDNSAAKYYVQYPSCQLEQALSSRQLDYFYLSGISLAILNPEDRRRLLDWLQGFTDVGGRVIFDNNYRPSLWEPDAVQGNYLAVLRLSYLALLTNVDEHMVFDSDDPDAIIERCCTLGVKEIVIKCGADPCVVFAEGKKFSIPAEKVERVVNTTAAGDSFAAAYLFTRLSGGSVIEGAQAGHKLASIVVQYQGAIIPETAH